MAVVADLPDGTPPAGDLATKLATSARKLVGIARIVTADQAALDVIAEHLGSGYRVSEGQLRVFLTHLNPDDPTDRFRHRFLVPHRFRSRPANATREISQIASQHSSVHRPPSTWERAAESLQGDDSGGSGFTEAEVEKLMDENSDLSQQISEMADARFDDALQIGQLQADLAAMQSRLAAAEQKLRENQLHADVVEETQEQPATEVNGAQEAVDAARQFYGDVLSIPEDACRDFDDMDTSPEGSAWALTAWQGLRALGEYARALRDGFSGDFYLWCSKGGSAYGWTANPKKLAMVESDAVRTRDKFRSTRLFPVDTKVDESGRIFMQAHLKIAEGGGMMAPRIYFHLDPQESRVHVGFYGPHKHTPNTKT
ncbi:MAG: hypothetical protein WKF57_06250 [Nakamurella sp.]